MNSEEKIFKQSDYKNKYLNEISLNTTNNKINFKTIKYSHSTYLLITKTKFVEEILKWMTSI